ncbi:hypothetical protein HMPREF3215_02085 [Staphylococcus simulans]|nr:hypothetical protein HMPREF3215_02085 [Staphylococcus simulans]
MRTQYDTINTLHMLKKGQIFQLSQLIKTIFSTHIHEKERKR